MARWALRYYPELDADEMHWVLVEATMRILPEVDPDMGAYTVKQLLRRRLDIRLGTRLESCVDGVVKLSDGDQFAADTIVWTAGVKPHPMLRETDLPLDEKGRLTCLPTLQVVRDGRVEVYAVGPAGELNKLRSTLERGPWGASVSEVNEENASLDTQYAHGFVITHDD